MTDAVLDASPAYLKACCSDLWSHPGVRLLAGETLRPGGLELTRRALDLADLPSGARVVDAGSGAGATLGELTTRGHRAIGLEYSRSLVAESAAVAPTTVGDAERLPFRTGSLDAVVLECVLSAVPDKGTAVRSVREALRPGGVVVLSDVVVEGPLPAPLDSFAGWVACAAGALRAGGYTRLLEREGFVVKVREDHSDAMGALVSQARRRLSLFRGAVAAGIVPGGFDQSMLDLGDQIMAVAQQAVSAGVLGYGLFIARSA
jgi:SAM-dependent methyltransferase